MESNNGANKIEASENCTFGIRSLPLCGLNCLAAEKIVDTARYGTTPENQGRITKTIEKAERMGCPNIIPLKNMLSKLISVNYLNNNGMYSGSEDYYSGF